MSDQKIKAALGKVPLNLIPLRALKGVARVFGYGVKKYKKGNWYTADDVDALIDRYVGGFLRHLADSQRPDGTYDLASIAKLDDESGLPEIDHALCGMIMLRGLLVKHGALPEDPGVGKEPPNAAAPLAIDDPRDVRDLSWERQFLARAAEIAGRESRCANPTYDMCDCRDCVSRSTVGEWNVPLSVPSQRMDGGNQ